MIILTAAGHELDKMAAFDAGADDYLTKPFGIQELPARMRAVWRRAPAGSAVPTQYAVGELLIDFAGRRVFVRKQEVRLTPTEYRLLALLARNSGKVLTHRYLLGEVWGPDHMGEANYLRVFHGRIAAEAGEKLRPASLSPNRPRRRLSSSRRVALHYVGARSYEASRQGRHWPQICASKKF